MSILQVNNVSKSFGPKLALDDISLTVEPGEIYGLLGPNGAGKTTLIRIINHITLPDSGEVIFDGHKLVENDMYSIGYLPEERGLYKKMKVGEQALFFAQLKGLNKREAEKSLKEWFERLEISDWWNKKVEELSKGMAQKVQFVITVLHRPKLLIFDEPFSGFDPINANILKREILALRDQGSTVIFSTHNMGSVEELCDRITLVNNARNILSGKVTDLKQKYSDNRYRMSFASGTGVPFDILAPVVSDLKEQGTNSMGNGVLEFALKEPGDLKAVISIANDNSYLTGVEPILPSMDDIFVRAVRNSNSNQ